MTVNYYDCEFFRKFIAEHCDRKNLIQKFLNEHGLDCPVIQLEGKNHLYVKFPMNQYNPMFKIKTIIAHYDRVENSPGANDNSAAVFVLMNFAAMLVKQKVVHNIRIIFTDGEELGAGGIKEQGAFALAQLFNKLGILRDEIFVFDCMGRGNIPIICENEYPKGLSQKLLKGIFDLETKTEKILKIANDGKWFKLPASYSDNASFIINGIPAVAITMLPSAEVDSYIRNKQTPQTWKTFHTSFDNLENLTPDSFEIFIRILNNLAVNKTLLDFT